MPIKKVYTSRYLRRAYEDGALTPEQISRLRDIGFQFKSRTRSRAVACYETGETWPSVKEAADALQISVTRMISALKKLRDIEGAHYYYLDSPKPRAEDLRETRRPRRVTCLETGVVYESTRAAAEDNGCKNAAVAAACDRGLRAGGLHFYFTDQPMPEPDFFVKGLTDSREILCIETGQVFNGCGEAARSLGISSSATSSAVTTGHAAAGVHLIYRDEYLKGEPEFRPSRQRGVRCVDTGEEFASIADASEALGYSRRSNAISNAIVKGTKAGGYRWEHIAGGRTRPAQREVHCIEADLYFKCLREAAEFAGVSRSAICTAIARSGAAGGYHWKYV